MPGTFTEHPWLSREPNLKKLEFSEKTNVHKNSHRKHEAPRILMRKGAHLARGVKKVTGEGDLNR